MGSDPARNLALDFGNGRTATAISVDRLADLSAVPAALRLDAPRPAIVVVGGAGGLDDPADLARLYPVFLRGLAPTVAAHDAVVLDGGTDAGVMRLLGRTRTELGGTFPLVGVAAAGTVSLPAVRPPRQDAAALDPNHSHFVLVPGNEWGDESSWIARIASRLAENLPSVTVVVNGGDVTYTDVGHSLAENRPVLVVAGTGRTAEQLTAAIRGEEADQRAVRLVAAGPVRTAGSPENPDALAQALEAVLRQHPAEPSTTRPTRPSGG